MKTKNINSNTAQIEALIEAEAPKNEELIFGDGEDKLIVKVCSVLPFTKRVEMVREIVDGVFMDNKDSVNTYMPEYLSLIQKYAVIKYFTDFKLPTKLDDMWLVLNYTSLYAKVVNLVGKDEIKDIFDAANMAIDTYRRYLTAKTDTNSFIDKIGNFIGDFESKISQEDIKDITSKVNDMSAGFSLQNIIGNLLGNKGIQG